MIIFCVVVLIALATIFIVSKRYEIKTWNNGIAPSGLPWQGFDTDSSGALGFKDGVGNYCWLSPSNCCRIDKS